MSEQRKTIIWVMLMLLFYVMGYDHGIGEGIESVNSIGEACLGILEEIKERI